MGEKKAPPNSFFPLTSANVGKSHQNFPTFSFNAFLHLCKTSRSYLVHLLKLLNFNQDYPSKNVFSGQILIKFRL